MKKEKLLTLSGKDPKSLDADIDLHRKKMIPVNIKVIPNVGNMTRILVTAKIKQSLLNTLQSNDLDSWIQVKAKIMDLRAGKEYGFQEFPRHAINKQDGGIRFEQDLVNCDDIRKCTGKKVYIKVKARFITPPLFVQEEWENVELPNDP